MNGLVGGQLISSILAVSCVSVAFCSNFLMVQDKANGSIKDLRIAPVKSSVLALMFLPGTYGTSLVRTHALQGALGEMQMHGVPAEVVGSLKDALDCNLYFFGDKVGVPAMYLILSGTVLVLIGLYILMNLWKKKIP